MADRTDLNEEQLAYAQALRVEDIKVKLRCGLCDKIAVRAWKLLCCDTSICEPCQQKLPDACSICQHTPLESNACRVNKPLRTTIKAEIKTLMQNDENRKNEALRAQAEAEKQSAALEASPPAELVDPAAELDIEVPQVAAVAASDPEPAQNTTTSSPRAEPLITSSPSDSASTPPPAALRVVKNGRVERRNTQKLSKLELSKLDWARPEDVSKFMKNHYPKQFHKIVCLQQGEALPRDRRGAESDDSASDEDELTVADASWIWREQQETSIRSSGFGRRPLPQKRPSLPGGKGMQQQRPSMARTNGSLQKRFDRSGSSGTPQRQAVENNRPNAVQLANGNAQSQDNNQDSGQAVVQNQEFGQNQTFGQSQGLGQNQTFGQNRGFGGMDYSNMTFNQIMAMQHNMNLQDMQSMAQQLNMPGMNMPDPSMMFGGGFGGMNGMMMHNMMNMNMNMGMMGGMNGFGGMPNMADMNGAFYPQNMGYNQQQNFGAGYMNNSNSYPQNDRGFGGRGHFNNNRGGAYNRGGRGGYYNRGRGGSFQNQGYHQMPGQNGNMQYQQNSQDFRGNREIVELGEQETTRGSPSYEPMDGANGTVSNATVHNSKTEDTPAAEPRVSTDDTNVAGNASTEQVTEATDGHPENGIEGKLPMASHSSDVASSPTHDQDSIATDDVDTNGPASRAAVGDPTDPPTTPKPADQARRESTATNSNNNGPAGMIDGFGNTIKSNPRGPVAAPTAPINAPTGPKAMRAGQPNNGRFSRTQPAVASVVAASPVEPERSNTKAREARGRTRSRSPAHSHAEERKSTHRSSSKRETSYDRHERRDDRSSRRRKERDESSKYDRDLNSDRPSKEDRSVSPDEGSGKRRHREKEDTRDSSRSRRESSRDRRKLRYRSRSPKKDDKDRDRRKDRYRSRSPKVHSHVDREDHESRHKSRSERKHAEEPKDSEKSKEREHKREHSRRGDGEERERKDRTSHSSRRHESKDGKHRERDYDRGERERDRRLSAIEDITQGGGEFKIKGRSAAMKQSEKHETEKQASEANIAESAKPRSESTPMRPPTTFKSEGNDRRSSTHGTTPTGPVVDIYAAEREKARKDREDAQRKLLEGRRASRSSLGKRSRDDEVFDAPTGPSGDGGRMHAPKRPRQDHRQHSLKYEGEIGQGHGNRRHR